jgi:hypothetical protein
VVIRRLDGGHRRWAFARTELPDHDCAMKNYYDVRTNVTVDQIAAPLGYHRNGLRLRLAWAENKTRYLTSLDAIRAVDVSGFYQQKEFPDGREIFKGATQDHRYVLVVAIEAPYFED